MKLEKEGIPYVYAPYADRLLYGTKTHYKRFDSRFCKRVNFF